MKKFVVRMIYSLVFMSGLLSLLGKSVSAYDLVETQWGFDGKVIPYQINPVFFLVQNNSPQDEDVVLQLSKTRGPGQFGARQVQEVYLSAGAERWVAFYVYLENSNGSVILTDGKQQKDTVQIPNQQAETKRSRVLLVDSSDQFRRTKATLPRFDEMLFPPSVTGTDSLEAVYLDHTPRWRQERRAAFWNWIKKGGRVHLLKGRDGEYPSFSNELSSLNASFDYQHIGAGSVFKHELTEKDLNKTNIEKIDSVETAFLQAKVATQPDSSQQGYSSYGYYHISYTENITRKMKELVNPHHNWTVIYSASFLYLLLVFPGGYLVSRWKKNYWYTYGVLLTGVVCFSLLFNLIGSRGYGESTQINTVALAQVLSDEEVDLTQYSNAFVTSGDYYRLEYEGSGQVYSTAQERERVNGIIHNGADAYFEVDIPPFSSRPFILRRQVDHSAPQFEITRYNETEGLASLVISASESVEFQPGNIWAIQGNSITSMKGNENNQFKSGKLGSLRKILENINNSQYGFRPSYYEDEESQVSAKRLYRESFNNLMLSSLNIVSQEDLEQKKIPEDRIYLFVAQPFPESLNAVNSTFAQQTGQILYAYELLLSESP